MGTTLVKEAAKARQDKPLEFNSQALQIDEFIVTLANEMKEENEKTFLQTNVQKNSQIETNFKENSIQKTCNEEFATGFATSEYLTKLLQENSHEKYFRVHTDVDTTTYTNLQVSKYIILHVLFLQKSEGKGTQQGFFEYVNKFLSDSGESSETSRTQVSLNTGLRFALSILKEIHQVSPSLLENSLRHLYEALCDAPAGSLYGIDVFAFQQDSTLDEARDFLVTLVKDRIKHSQTLVELSLQTIIRLGIVRSNVEDLVIVACLLAQNKWLAQTVDLRNEIRALPTKGVAASANNERKETVSIKEQVGILKQTLGSVAYGDRDLMKEDVSWTTDGQSLYYVSGGIQKIQAPKDRNDTIFEEDQNTSIEPALGSNAKLCFLSGSLYVRDTSQTEKPLIVFDSKTLQIDEKATEAIKFSVEEDAITMSFTEKAHKDTGRLMGDSPLFTDGTHIYVVSQKKHIKPADADEDAVSVPTALVVEKYCPSTWKHLNSTALFKNEHSEIFNCKKQPDVDEYLKTCTFHTNGTYLLLCHGKKRHMFDLATGIRVEKQTDDKFVPLVVHDYLNSRFFTFQKADTDKYAFVSDFTIDAIKVQNKGLTKPAEESAVTVQRSTDSGASALKEQYLKGHVTKTKTNIIQRKMMKKVADPVTTESQPLQENTASLIIAILLDHIKENCEQFGREYAKMELNQNQSENYLKFFHWPGATYLTASLFEGLRELLDHFKTLINGKKSAENLADQMSFLSSISILSANFQALSYCGIKLAEILDEQSSAQFVNVFQSSIVFIIENGYKKDDSDMQLCGELWQEIYSQCQKMMSFSVQLVYADAQAVISSLASVLSDTNLSEKQAENSAFKLQYLTSSVNISKLLQTENKDVLKDLEIVISSLDRIQTARLHAELDRFKLFQTLPEESQPTLFSQACDRFQRNFSEQLLEQLEKVNIELQKKVDRTPAGKQKRKKDEENQQQLQSLIATVFSQFSTRNTTAFVKLQAHIQSEISNKEKSFFNKDSEKLYKQFCKRIHSIFTSPSKLHLLNLYITTLGQITGEQPSMCSSVANSAVSLAESLTKLVSYIKSQSKLLKGEPDAEIESDNEVQDDEIKNDFTSALILMIRRVCWLVGSISFNLIRIKSEALTPEQAKEENAAQKMARLLLESKVLSGGIEDRFISTFAKETKDLLKPILEISNDSQSLNKLNQETPNLTSEDQLLDQVLKQGSNPTLDLLIELLQFALEQPQAQVQHAKVSGADGLKLSRVAFAVMIKYSSQSDTLEELLNEVEILDGQIEMTTEKVERLRQMRTELKDNDEFKSILHEWNQASKIRVWIMEKKKNLSEKIETKQREEFIKQKKDRIKKAKEAAAKEKETTENGKETKVDEAQKPAEPVEVQIDTTAKTEEQLSETKAETVEPSEETKTEDKKPEEDEEDIKLTTEEKAEIQNLAYTQLDSDLNEIFQKIIAKAEYLLKMQVPAAYKVSKESKEQDLALISAPSFMPQAEAAEQEKLSEQLQSLNWQERLKMWKSLKDREGDIKSPQKLRSEIFDSGKTSVLACLLTPISVSKIQKRVETDFLKASRRAAGLLILSRVMNLEISQQVQTDLSNWFSASLRDRSNTLTHYLSNIKTCGDHLEIMIRTSFFSILKSILGMIKASRDKKHIIRLLDAVQWKFQGRDHKALLESDFFRCLRQGDGYRKHPINQAWGKRAGLKNWEVADEPTCLQYVLLETFENLFFNIISRIVDSDLGTSMQLKKSGTAIPVLERSKSIISTSTSESLIGESFHILFKELNRYVHTLKNFPGVDYQLFVNLHNKIQVANLKDSADNKIGKEFEEEFLYDVDEEEEQYQKVKSDQKKAEEALKEKTESEQKVEELPAETEKQQEEEEEKGEPVSTEEVKVEVVSEETTVITTTEEEKTEKTADQEEEIDPLEAEEIKKAEALSKETESFEMIQAKIKELELTQSKALHKLYDGAYLRRLLRMIEIFTSVAQTQAHALAMVQRVANPYMLQILINLFTFAEPRNQVIVIKIIQNLIRIGIPSEVFEVSMQQIKSQSGSQAILETKSSFQMKSQFVTFWLGQLYILRSAMFSETQVQSFGSYEVSQEISRLINTILVYYQSHYQEWCAELKSMMTTLSLRLEHLSHAERDVVLCLIPGADFSRMSIGTLAKTEENQLMTVLGYRETPKDDQPKPTKLKPTFTKDNERLVGLYFAKDFKEQQEIVEVSPHSAKPVLQFNEEINITLAKQSLLNQPEVLKYFINLLVSDTSSADLKVQILKAVSQILTVLKHEFLNLLQQNELLSVLLTYLFKTKLARKAGSANKDSVIPTAWLEARITNIRVHAIENCKSLQKSILMKCQVLKNKQLVFTHTDKESGCLIGQNASIISSINMHKVMESTKYIVKLDSDSENSSVCKQWMSFIDGENLMKLDSNVLRIMKSSESIVTYDVNVRQLIAEISAKGKQSQEAKDAAEGKEAKEAIEDWSQVYNCVVFVIKKESWGEIIQSHGRSFFTHNKIELKGKTTDSFADFKDEMKTWAGVDIDSLMYHFCILENLTLDALKAALPEVLKKVEEEQTEQQEKLKRLELEGASNKFTAEKERIVAINEERNKKIQEVLGLGTAFKTVELESAFEKLIKKATGSAEVNQECELYDLLDTKKENLKIIDKLIEEQFKAKVDSNQEAKMKSDQAKCKMYLKEITTFNENDLPKSYDNTFTQLLGEYASQTLLEVMITSDFKVLAPILLNSREQRKQLSCFLKSSFNSAQLTFNSTGQKLELKLIKNLIRKLFAYCLSGQDAQSSEFVDQFIYEDILLPGIATLKKLESEKSLQIQKHFVSEEDAIEQLHPSLLCFAISIILEFRVKIVLESKSYLPTLMSLALGMFVKFWTPNDSVVPMKLLMLCQNIVFFVQEYLETYLETGVVQKIINSPIITYIIKEIDYTVKEYSAVQQLLLDVYLSMITLRDMAESKSGHKIDSVLQMTPGISLAKRALRIVKEKQDFKLLKYYIHQSGISAHQSKSLNQFFGTMHPHLDVKIRAKYSIQEVERMQFKANEKCELKPFTFLGISQTSDGKDIKLYSKETLKEAEGVTKFNSAHFYVFYPIKKQMVIGMGESKRSRMGVFSASDIPQVIKSTQELNAVKVATSRNSTILLTEDGELYSTGEKYGSTHSDFTQVKLPKDEVPDKIFCGRKCKFVIAKSGKTFYLGESNEFELPNNTNSNSFKEFKLSTDESNTEKIIDISLGMWYNLYVTDKGKVWATGRKFLKRVGIDSDVAMCLTLPVTDGPLFVMKAWTSQVKEEQSALIQVKTQSGEIQLWSVGKNESGLLGQGGKIKETKVFQKLDYDSSAIKFQEVSQFDDHAMAIDQNGLLWAWGNNQQGRAGLGDDIEGVFKPTKVSSFEVLGLKAVKISCGRNHSLVLAQEENGQVRLYSIGKDGSNFKNLGCTQQQASETVIRKITHLTDFEIQDFSACTSFSMIIIKGEKLATDGLYEHKITEEKTVKGVLHAYQKEGKWHYMSQEEYETTKGADLPEISLAFKCPIPNMDIALNGPKPLISVELASLINQEGAFETVLSSYNDVEIKGPLYTANTKIGGDELKVNLSEKDLLHHTTQFDLHPLIYFRLNKPLKAGVRLPVLDLKTIYGQTSKYGFEFEVTPDFSYVENKKLLDSTAEQFKEYCDTLNKFPEEGDKELFKQMDKQLTSLSGEIELKDIEKFNVKDMTFKEEKDDGKLFKVANLVKEKRVNLIWHYNYFFVKLQKYLVSKPNKGFKGQKIENSSAANIFNQVKHLILTSVKMNFVDTSIDSLSTGSQKSVTISRNDALRFEESGKVDHTSEHTIFGQIFKQLKGDYECWKQNKPDDQALRVEFNDESAIDAGGPYRDTLTNFVMEMESGVLPLIMKTANNKTNHGENRNCFIVNPDSVTPTHQQMFKFMGVLLGNAFRSKSCMPWNMAPVFWKKLMGQPLVENDINSIDTYTWQMFQTLRKNAKKIASDSEFEQIVDQNFTITINGKEIELCEGGQSRMVNKSNMEEFISMMCEKRFQEGVQQTKWIKEGMDFIIPPHIVGIVGWEEVEDRCAGMKTVDVDKLKSITEYRNCDADTKVVKMFWNVLARLSEEDKTAYLKFVWGRQRMPFDCSTLRYNHRIAFMEHWNNDQLPESHTCFFAIDIPNYENEEILEKKLLISIRFCGEIDND